MQTKQDQRTIRQARTLDNVMNSALWHLTQKDLTEAELRERLVRKTDNQEWIDTAVGRLFELGYLKTDVEFAERFAESRFFADYGSAYITNKLKQKGLKQTVIDSAIQKVTATKQIDEQAMLNQYVLSYYVEFTMSREKLYNTLQKRGFTYDQVKKAVEHHPRSIDLKSKLELKAEKVDLTKAVLTYARKGKGLTAIRSELINKKVDVTDLNECVRKLINDGELDFYANCLEQLGKKNSYDLNEYSDRSKAYAYLSRKGYASDEIKYALEAITEDCA